MKFKDSFDKTDSGVTSHWSQDTSFETDSKPKCLPTCSDGLLPKFQITQSIIPTNNHRLFTAQQTPKRDKIPRPFHMQRMLSEDSPN
jgi:hypothetical protein